MSIALQLPPPYAAPDLARAETSLLRVLTCGSVDDGKSTLLGRLLYDSHAVFDDQLAALDQESRRWGSQGEDRDFALLLDGLSAEREQGITIDVAYRYVSTQRRSFIVADAPGHEQYTRNMATAASNAELAIILIDARKGVLAQTRRHAFIAATLGIRHAVLAINKMDLVGFSRDAFERIAAEFRAATASLGFASIVAIPICARDGDNVVSASPRTPWFQGRPLLDHLETVAVEPAAPDALACMPVQLVLRPNPEFRGYAGTLAAGTLRAGQPVLALPARQPATIARIVTADGDREEAVAGQSVTLTLDREIDLARGDVLAAGEVVPDVASRVTARLLWMDAAPLTEQRDLIVRLGTASANARVVRVAHAIDIETYQSRPAAALALNEIGLVELAFDRPLAAAPYGRSRTLGALILVDRATNRTAGMAVIEQVGDPAEAPRPARFRMPVGLLGAAVLWTLTIALSKDLLLASILAGADLLIRPALARLE